MGVFPAVGRCLVLSPHLDDAAFSCGELIAHNPGTVVVTVFTGMPAARGRLTMWDAASGFVSAGQAVAQRREEDSAALRVLAARPVWLDFCDNQYGGTPALAELAQALAVMLHEEMPQTVCFPAGLLHADHVLVHQATLLARRQHADKAWLMYEDALYRRWPGVLQQRLQALAQAGLRVTLLGPAQAGMLRLKQRAVRCYKSQLQALSLTVHGYADAFAPERYWQLDGPA